MHWSCVADIVKSSICAAIQIKNIIISSSSMAGAVIRVCTGIYNEIEAAKHLPIALSAASKSVSRSSDRCPV